MDVIENYLKTCPFCEQEYEASRLNQTYCSALCKTRYNNYKAKKAKINYEYTTRKHNKILWLNRNILMKYVGQEIDVELLKREGFQLNFITSFFMEKKTKNNILFVYDFKYFFLNERTIKISKHE